MGEYFVYVAKDTAIASADTSKKSKGTPPQGPSLHAIQKKIALGQTISDRIIVRSGLQDGDSLIVDGVQKLHDGSLITTANTPGAPQGQAGGKK